VSSRPIQIPSRPVQVRSFDYERDFRPCLVSSNDLSTTSSGNAVELEFKAHPIKIRPTFANSCPDPSANQTLFFSYFFLDGPILVLALTSPQIHSIGPVVYKYERSGLLLPVS